MVKTPRTSGERFATGNHSSLRDQNLSSILGLIHRNRPISRVELSRMTGLNKATVSSIVAELVDADYVKFIGENPTERAGRREVLIDINASKISAISVEIGIGTLAVMVADLAGETTARHDSTFDLGDSPSKTISALSRFVAKALSGEVRGKIAGFAVAVPGAVDQKEGKILFAPNLGWRSVPIRDRLLARFDPPMFIDNEASLAALGEQYFGAAKDLDNVLYISAGAGLGGGLIVGGEVYRGSSGIAGEFGHMTVELNGKQCACGKRGCWETIANQAAVFDEFRRLGAKRKRPSPDEMIASILRSAQNGEPGGLGAVKFLAHSLAVGIDSLIKSFDPQRVVLGGPLSSLGDVLIPMIALELRKRPMFDVDHSADVMPAAFGADAALKGGVARVIRSVLADPML